MLVASTPERLTKGEGDLWGSGKVSSSDTSSIVYGGQALGSAGLCHWKLRVGGRNGRASGWSRLAKWTMGQLDAGN